MVYIILLLGFGAGLILCFELIPERINFSRKNFGRWIIYKIARINGRLTIDNFRNRTKNKLSLAGNPFGWNPDEFLTIKELLGAGLFLIFFLSAGSFLLSLLLFIVGFFLPDLWLNEKILRRKIRIVRELPYFIDILTLSVEAGLDFGAAINKIVQKNPATPLNEELKQMREEMKVGRTRKDALYNLAKRVEIPQVSSFVSALIQTDNMGSPLADTLRIQSEQMHLTRFLRAEKKAQEAPVKMLFPLVIFIFPVIFIVLFGPVILQLLSQ